MKARIFKTVKMFDEKADKLKRQGKHYIDYYIKDTAKYYPTFEDTREEIPSWSGEIYAEYYYNKKGKLVEIIALW